METKVIWSARSEKSLQKIHYYIAQDSEIYADRFISSLVQSADNQLTSQPNIGKEVPEFVNTPLSFLKQIIFKGYRIIHNPTVKGRVTITTVINGRMDVIKHFSE